MSNLSFHGEQSIELLSLFKGQWLTLKAFVRRGCLHASLKIRIVYPNFQGYIPENRKFEPCSSLDHPSRRAPLSALKAGICLAHEGHSCPAKKLLKLFTSTLSAQRKYFPENLCDLCNICDPCPVARNTSHKPRVPSRYFTSSISPGRHVLSNHGSSGP